MSTWLTQKEMLEEVETHCEKDFAGHEVKRHSQHSWLCKTPGTSAMWFGVFAGPACVVIYGDIGDVILNPNSAGHDPFRWCKNLRPSEFDYALKKSAASQEVRSFSVGEAKAYIGLLRECEDDDGEHARLAKVVSHEWDCNSEHSWIEEMHRAGHDDPPGCMIFSREALRCFTALVWLMARLDDSGNPVEGEQE